MMVLKSFSWENIEYMICETEVLPRERIALLCSHKQGVGAERILFVKSAVHSCRVFDAQGIECVPTEKDLTIFAHYLVGRSGNVAKDAARGCEIFCTEIHLTQAFCQKLGMQPVVLESLAC